MIASAMAPPMQAMLYVRGCSAVFSMACAPLCVATLAGVCRLEDQLKQEAEPAQFAAVTAQPYGAHSVGGSGAATCHGIGKRRRLRQREDDALWRLARSSATANQAVVKGK